MSKATIDGLARAAAKAINAEDWDAAIKAIAAGRALAPDANLPHELTWDKLEALVELKRSQAAQAEAEAEAAQTVQATVQETAPEQDQAEAAPEARGFTIVHTLADGTMLPTPHCDSDQLRKLLSRVMGKSGQQWGFNFRLSTGSPGWYIRGSRDGGPDMPRILPAQQALEAEGFAVTVDIEEQSRAVAPTLSKAERERRGQQHSRRVNSLRWNLTTEGGLACSKCATDGLHTDTARLVDNPLTGLPEAQCVPCTGEAQTLPEAQAAPVAPLMLDEPEEIEAEQDQVQDSPAVPARESARKRAPRSVSKSAPAAGFANVDDDALVAIVKLTGDKDAVAELVRRANGGVRTAAPKAAASPVPESGPITFTVALESDAHLRHTASDVRRSLYAEVTRPNRQHGVEISVFASKGTNRLEITIAAGTAGPRIRAQLASKALEVAQSVKGVASELVPAA